MRRRAKEQRVRFEGKDLSISTVESYAGDPKHPLNQKAKAFLSKSKGEAKAKAKEDTKKDWTDKMESNFKDLPKWGPGLSPIVQVLVKPLSIAGKLMMKKTPDPAKTFEKGFALLSNVDSDKVYDSIADAAKTVFGDELDDKEAKKIGKAVTESRKSTLSAISTAAKDLGVATAKISGGLAIGLLGAAVAGAGKVVGGSTYLIAETIDSQIRQLHKMAKDSEKDFQDIMEQFFGYVGKDEMGAVAQFIDEDGVFDQKGYEAEMKKALEEIKGNLSKYVGNINKKCESEEKKASIRRVVSAYRHKKRRLG